MRGKIIVIEGSDGCGKETQSYLLQKSLKEKGINSIVRSFPSYGKPQAGPVESYLSGDMGDISDMTPQQIITIYLVDMFVSYKLEKWDDILDSGTWIIMDRYVESNILYQASKYDDISEAMNIIRYIMNKGYNVFSLPKPSLVLYLNLSESIATQLIINRNNKKDIHESNQNYMTKVHSFGLDIAKTLEWFIISCDNELHTSIRAREEIQKDILKCLDIVFNDKTEE